MLELYDDVKHTRASPGAEAKVRVRAYILRGQEVTRKLGDDLAALPVPSSDHGRAAAGYFADFARLASERLTVEAKRARELPESITLVQSIRSLDGLEVAVIEAFADMTSPPDVITTQVPALRDAFEDSTSCDAVASLGVE